MIEEYRCPTCNEPMDITNVLDEKETIEVPVFICKNKYCHFIDVIPVKWESIYKLERVNRYTS